MTYQLRLRPLVESDIEETAILAAMSNGIKERIGLQGVDGLKDFVDKSSAEAGLLFFIPFCPSSSRQF